MFASHNLLHSTFLLLSQLMQPLTYERFKAPFPESRGLVQDLAAKALSSLF